MNKPYDLEGRTFQFANELKRMFSSTIEKSKSLEN